MSRSVLLSALLVACAPPGPPEDGAPESLPDAGGLRIAGLTLSVTPPVPGDQLVLTVTGAGAFEQIQVARSLVGPGSGPCFGTLSALCLDIAGPVQLHATLTADTNGVAVLEQTLPETLPIGTHVAFQAVVPRGTSGLNWGKSNVVTEQIEDAPLHAGLFQPGDLRITEILVDPDAVPDASGEWFEVLNASALDANLDGLVLSDGVSVSPVAGTTFLAAGERLVFGTSADPATNGGAPVDRVYTGLSLANAFGEVALLDGATPVDVVGWDDGTSFPLQPGRSVGLAEDADHLDNDLGSSWCAGDTTFGAGDRGTPGAVNDSCEPVLLLASDSHATLSNLFSDATGPMVSLGDIDGDGFGDLAIADTNFSDGVLPARSGRVFIVHGPLAGTFDLANATGHLDGESSYDYAGTSLAAVGDVDGDGRGDLLIGAPEASDGTDDVGIAYLITDPVVGPTSLASAHARLLGEGADDEAGFSVARVGDLNADGFADLLIGAPRNGANGPLAGATYIVHGPVVGDFDLANADARLLGIHDYDFAGEVVAGIGDINGDGIPDLAITAPNEATNAAENGAVYVVHGPVVGDFVLDQVAAATILGEVEFAGTGVQVAGVGDVDGDGFDDLLVGLQDLATAYLFYGPVSGDLVFDDADAVLTLPEDPNSRAGASIHGPGDLNGDGFDDLLIGAPVADGETLHSVGMAFVVHGPVLGEVDLRTEADITLQGDAIGANLGSSISSAGDIDGDGLIDLLATHPGEDAIELFLGSQW